MSTKLSQLLDLSLTGNKQPSILMRVMATLSKRNDNLQIVRIQGLDGKKGFGGALVMAGEGEDNETAVYEVWQWSENNDRLYFGHTGLSYSLASEVYDKRVSDIEYRLSLKD